VKKEQEEYNHQARCWLLNREGRNRVKEERVEAEFLALLVTIGGITMSLPGLKKKTTYR